MSTTQSKGVRPPKFTRKTWDRLVREMKQERDAKAQQPAPSCPCCGKPLTE